MRALPPWRLIKRFALWLDLQELLREPRQTEWNNKAADHLADIRFGQLSLGIKPWTADDYFWEGFMEGEPAP